jgi:diguanylate cyclase (GGDEF)-like protein
MIGASDHWKALFNQKRPCLADLLIQGRLEDAKSLYEAWSDPETNPNGLSSEGWCAMPRTGIPRYLAFDVEPIYGESGELIAVVETLRDLTSHKLMETELETRAGQDALTSIANRRTFDTKLAEECVRAARHGAPLSLLVVDVDFFKQYNDIYGHQMGDECLKLVAQIVKDNALRRSDLAARIGGEEFAVILPQTSNQGAAAVATRLRCAVEGSRMLHSGSPISSSVTVSIGVITRTTDMDAVLFFTRADAALSEAKKRGRNRVANFG